MSECEYWWTDESAELCGLTNSRCACDGVIECCPICGNVLSDALRLDEQTAVQETILRARRRRELDTAN